MNPTIDSEIEKIKLMPRPDQRWHVGDYAIGLAKSDMLHLAKLLGVSKTFVYEARSVATFYKKNIRDWIQHEYPEITYSQLRELKRRSSNLTEALHLMKLYGQFSSRHIRDISQSSVPKRSYQSSKGLWIRSEGQVLKVEKQFCWISLYGASRKCILKSKYHVKLTKTGEPSLEFFTQIFDVSGCVYQLSISDDVSVAPGHYKFEFKGSFDVE